MAVYELEGHELTCGAVGISPDGRTAITGAGRRSFAGGGELLSWNLESGELIRQLGGEESIVSRAVFSADGNRVLTPGFVDRNVTLWDVSTGEILQRIDLNEEVDAVEFGTTEDTVVVGSRDGSLAMYRLETGEHLWSDENRYIREFTPEECEQYRIDPCN